MPSGPLPPVVYEPQRGPSIFERWEHDPHSSPPAPPAVRDPAYRQRVIGLMRSLPVPGRSLLSIGAGTGHIEVELQAAGWQVCASDPAPSALAICGSKGLPTVRFALTRDRPFARFDVIYCDGVMGHLWDPASASVPAWSALADLGHTDSVCVVSNDLSDDDDTARFAVRGVPDAAFYRPPATWYGRDARSTSLWSVESEDVYDYVRTGSARRREIVVARLLTDERVEPEDAL